MNIKKISLFLIVVLAISMSCFAQITNTKINEQITIDHIYAGMLTGSMFSVDSLNATSFTTLRFGAMATYAPKTWISFKSLAILQAEAGSASWKLGQFWMKLKPTKKLSFEVGNMGTLPTEQRPLPTTGNGQFETWTEASIPGQALNAKMKYAFNDNFVMGGGVAVRNMKPEYSGMITYKAVTLSSWYSEYNKKAAAALTVKYGDVSSILVWKQDQILANITNIMITKDLDLYSDMGYDFTGKKLVRGEWGILKLYSSQWVSGLFGLGYASELRAINGYFFIHL